ncbi:hypothetical protein AAHH79_43840, partial [Burkholderia pseudomallei]
IEGGIVFCEMVRLARCGGDREVVFSVIGVDVGLLVFVRGNDVFFVFLLLFEEFIGFCSGSV